METQGDIVPGIYFGMSDEKYHSLPYLSATGIKNLLVSPMDFWARSWMNPWKEEDEQESEAKTLGKAYHKRILEGRAAFDSCYASVFECDDPDVIKTGDDIKAALRVLKDSGHPCKITFSKKEDGIAELLQYDPYAKIFDDLKGDYEREHAGKTFLTDQMIRKIELSAKMIECHHALKYYFVGGYPEVTVIWDDEAYGLRMKARFDYLKVNAVNDLKTFANMMNKNIERAVYGEMAGRKYHIQAALYLRAVEVAKEFTQDAGQVFWISGPEPEPAWLAAFRAAPHHAFNFVFQQKGPAPVSVGAVFSREDNIHDVALTAIDQGVAVFKRAMETFGEDPWVDMRDPITLHWQQYPAFINDL